MLIRFVHLTIQPESTEAFIAIFEHSKPVIEAQVGCYGVTLVQNVHQDNQFSTISQWEDEAALNRYRDTDFFKGVWGKTKALFADKPMAMSYEVIG